MKSFIKFKKFALLTMSLILVLCTACFACDCGGEAEVTLDKTSLTLEVGAKATITASVEDPVWASADEKIATVVNGEVTAIAQGTTTVTAEKDGKTASCTVTVTETLISAVNFYLTEEKTVIYKGRSTTFSSVMYYGENLVDNTVVTVTYSSSDESVAKVDTNGKVTGIGVGKATITASVVYKDVTYTDSAEIEVKECVVLIANKENLVVASDTTVSGAKNTMDNTVQFEFKAIDANEDLVEIDMTKVTYTTDKESVAAVNSSGLIEGKSAGTATVTASYNGEVCTATVTVGTAITSKEDMDKLGTAQKDGKVALWGTDKYYVLANDIDYQNTAIIPIAAPNFGATWNEKYGNLNATGSSFEGTFDGNGHTIKNALIYTPQINGGQYIGSCVFGVVLGTIKNVCFDTIKFEVENNEYVSHSGIICNLGGTAENILVLNASINSSCASNFGMWNASAILVSQVFNDTIKGVVKNCIVSANYTTGSASKGLTAIVYGKKANDAHSEVVGTIENVYAINTSNQVWCHYSCDSTDNYGDGNKYVTTAALNEAHHEMFDENSAFAYNSATGAITLK